jgi:hypothetical protein
MGMPDKRLALADMAARAVAVIRMWPKLDLQGAGGQEFAPLVTSCLELGVAMAHEQLLVQSAQALTMPHVKGAMFALNPDPCP